MLPEPSPSRLDDSVSPGVGYGLGTKDVIGRLSSAPDKGLSLWANPYHQQI